MITKEDYEKAKEITNAFERQCSKCNNEMKNTLYKNSFEIKINSTIENPCKKLWGDDYEKINFEHPALRISISNPQTIRLEIGSDYKLCEKCHGELIELIGNFIKIN